MFSNIVPNHTLKLFPGANHNFIGKYEEIVQAILEYFEEHEKNAYEKGTLSIIFLNFHFILMKCVSKTNGTEHWFGHSTLDRCGRCQEL